MKFRAHYSLAVVVLMLAFQGRAAGQVLDPGPQVLTFYSDVDDTEQPYALYLPPFNWRILARWPTFWERLGLILWPTFSGVIMVEATKQVYAAMPVRLHSW